jgi:hypothetical protein
VHVLDEIELRLDESCAYSIAFVRALVETDAPSPGGTMTVSIAEEDFTYKIERPLLDSEAFSDVLSSQDLLTM